MSLSVEQKSSIIEEYRRSATDTGSPEVQGGVAVPHASMGCRIISVATRKTTILDADF